MKLETYSRECQDIFISSLFSNKKNGYYVEIGSQHPIVDSNTYLLEKKLNWSGISFEINKDLVNLFNEKRKNPCICADATNIDYDSLFKNYNVPSFVDFLQLDIEPANNTFLALKKINFEKYSFGFITFEHEFYREGDSIQNQSRQYIQKKGYKLLIKDVSHANKAFEDWYIKENFFNYDTIESLVGNNINMNLNDIDKKYYDFIIKTINENYTI